jgi:hypothetical protein
MERSNVYNIGFQQGCDIFGERKETGKDYNAERSGECGVLLK